jgi:hypothetical protein
MSSQTAVAIRGKGMPCLLRTTFERFYVKLRESYRLAPMRRTSTSFDNAEGP